MTYCNPCLQGSCHQNWGGHQLASQLWDKKWYLVHHVCKQPHAVRKCLFCCVLLCFVVFCCDLASISRLPLKLHLRGTKSNTTTQRWYPTKMCMFFGYLLLFSLLHALICFARGTLSDHNCDSEQNLAKQAIAVPWPGLILVMDSVNESRRYNVTNDDQWSHLCVYTSPNRTIGNAANNSRIKY